MKSIEELINKHNLGHVSSNIQAAVQNCIVGTPTNTPPSLLGSKVGGKPACPSGFQWPKKRDVPLEFIAQVNLSDLAHPLLPESGLLSFFYDNRHWGYDSSDDGFVKLYYYKEFADLMPHDPPQYTELSLFGLRKKERTCRTYREAGLKFTEGFSVPSYDRDIIPLTSDENTDCYGELMAECDYFVQLFGWPSVIQSDTMHAECATIRGVGREDDWLLLFQIGNDKATDMMWGDAGKLYFWILRDDLQNLRFDRVWMITQCH